MKRMKKVFAMLLAFAMVMGMSLTTFAAAPTAADSTRATVYNVEKNATVVAYQITKGSYNANGFVEYVKVNDSLAISNVNAPNSTEVTAIAQSISTNNNPLSLPSKTMEMTASTVTGMATYQAELEAGYWVVLVSGVAEVYNPMLVGVYYSVSGSDNTLESGSVNANSNWTLVTTDAYAKSSNTLITKNANGTTWDLGDTVTYTVTSKVPDYSDSYVTEAIEYKIVDAVTAGELAITTNTIAVKVGETIVDASNYTLTATEAGYTIDFKGSWVTANAGATITITYDATITGEIYADDAENNSHDNTVQLTYTNAPGTEKIVQAEESIYTFKVEGLIVKTGEDGEDVGTEPDPLAGATFTIYTDASCTDDKIYRNAIHGDGTAVSLEETGYVNFYGLDLGTYYIKETIAPAGYSINNTVYKIVVSATETRVENDGDKVEKITVTLSENGKDGTANAPIYIPNTKISALPSTGGIGTAVFTIGGCVIMIAAACFFFVNRKKES